jgi:putative transposase
VGHSDSSRHRRSIRLAGYDYAQAGAYVVTVCVRNRERLLGEIVQDELLLNDLGQAVVGAWRRLADLFPAIELDAYVVMPNHVHGIVLITHRQTREDEDEGAMNRAPTEGASAQIGARNPCSM